MYYNGGGWDSFCDNPFRAPLADTWIANGITIQIVTVFKGDPLE
jgi:hypothetical protein